MIKTLEQYILDDRGCKNSDHLVDQNEKYKKKLIDLQIKLGRADSINLGNVHLHANRLQQVIYILNKSQQQLKQQKMALYAQSQQINNLIAYVQKYLSQQGSEPRNLEKKIKQLKNLIQQAQAGEYPKTQIEKMWNWNTKLIQSLQKKLCQLVIAFSSSIRIRLQDIKCYKDLLNEQICRQFVRILFRDILVYDVPTFSYILLVPEQQINQNGTIVVKRQTVIFTCENAQQNNQKIQKSIKQAERLSLKICQVLRQEQQQYCQYIKSEIKNCQEDVKAQIQYILPYLKLEKRKILIQLLSTKSGSQATLYDILVRLRIKGQDGDMLESNVSQLVQKIQQSPELMTEVVYFLEMCESEQKSLNIGLYVCDQLINRLEDYVQYSQIQKLLTLRESMRFKIHHRD